MIEKTVFHPDTLEALELDEPDFELRLMPFAGEALAEVEIKRSRFLAHVAHVESEEEAFFFIEMIRKQYRDARHCCYAFTWGTENPGMRFSDDGEPAGTAGKPILDTLTGSGLKNTCITVTRYFGGTLLGTGGLVHAYSSAACEGLKAAQIIEKHSGSLLTLRLDYTLFGKIQYLANTEGLPVLSTDFADCVIMKLLVDDELKSRVSKLIIEATSGRIQPDMSEKCTFALIDKKAVVFA